MSKSKKTGNPKPRKKPQKKTTQSFFTIIKKWWAIALASLALLGAFPTYDYFKIKYFTSAHEKFIADNYAQGDLKPPQLKVNIKNITYSFAEFPPNFAMNRLDGKWPIIKGIKIPNFNKLGYVIVVVGSVSFTLFESGLEKGADVISKISNCSGEMSHLIVTVRDERLYVSAEFKDLEKEETIGFIEYNHWKLYMPNLLDFRNDDTRLEVKDKQNHIVFSIEYIGADGVFINGYLINQKSIFIMNPISVAQASISPAICILKSDNNWKQKALDEIIQIKSTYK